MLDFLRRKSKKGKNSVLKGDLIYDFLVDDFANISEMDNDLFDQISEGVIDGIILENVLSQAEIDQLLSKLNEIPPERKIFNDKNNIYPRGFASYMEDASGDESLDFKTYFEHADNYIKNLKSNFGIDLTALLKDIFERFSNNRKHVFLEGENQLGVFPHCQFRVLYPNKGLFPVHCGNVFHYEFEKFYKRLSHKAKIKDQMSFFILLQKPDKGGELVLFDILWEEGQRMVPVDGIQLADGSVIDPIKSRKVKKMTLDLKPGDMLMFSGGPIWHKVTMVEGKHDRITLGGFFSTTADGKNIVTWA